MLRQRVGTLLFSLQKTIEGERAVERFYKVSSVAMWEMDWKAYLEEKGRFRDLFSTKSAVAPAAYGFQAVNNMLLQVTGKSEPASLPDE